jgi:hypothetical protein
MNLELWIRKAGTVKKLKSIYTHPGKGKRIEELVIRSTSLHEDTNKINTTWGEADVRETPTDTRFTLFSRSTKREFCSRSSRSRR